MSYEVSVQQMAVEALAQRCEHETYLYFKRKEHDTRYCFELFRRALEEKSEEAWKCIINQYEAMVTGWVTQQYSFTDSSANAEDFVSEAFSRISRTITADKFGKFTDLGSLLRYLKLCVHSVIVDFTRATDYANLSAWEETSETERSEDPLPEERAVDQSDRRMLWSLLDTRLHDEKERLVIQGSFVFDLKPQEILDQFRGKFSDIDEVYRVKQNVIVRLRRDAEFRKLLGVDD